MTNNPKLHQNIQPGPPHQATKGTQRLGWDELDQTKIRPNFFIGSFFLNPNPT